MFYVGGKLITTTQQDVLPLKSPKRHFCSFRPLTSYRKFEDSDLGHSALGETFHHALKVASRGAALSWGSSTWFEVTSTL